jgi:hypothetical protein
LAPAQRRHEARVDDAVKLRDFVCAHCGKPFTAYRPTARFCSHRCQLRAARQARLPVSEPDPLSEVPEAAVTAAAAAGGGSSGLLEPLGGRQLTQTDGGLQ